MKLPLNIHEITVEWMEHVLSGSWPGIKLEAIAQRAVIHGSATKLRFELNHATESGGGPASVWVKIGFEEYSDLLSTNGIYSTEAICYAHVIDAYGLGAPRCYFQQVQTEPAQVALILEDLLDHGVRFGRATEPRRVEELRSGLAALARVHAMTWGKEDDLSTLGLRPVLTWGEVDFLNEFVDGADTLFQSPRGYAVPLALHDKARLKTGWDRYRQAVLEAPLCLLHGDAHVGNSYVHPNGEVAFLDWQCAAMGHWSHDVSYYMASAADIPDRRAVERDLLEGYLSVLRGYGVDAPPFELAWQQYRRSMIFAFLIWLGNPESMQPAEIATACFSRAGAAMLDLDTYEALGV